VTFCGICHEISCSISCHILLSIFVYTFHMRGHMGLGHMVVQRMVVEHMVVVVEVPLAI